MAEEEFCTPITATPADAIVADIPSGPKRAMFDLDRWKGLEDRSLSSAIQDVLSTKGYKEAAGLITSITKDSSNLVAYTKENGAWVSTQTGNPVLVSPDELDFLIKRMPELPEQARDGVVKRYLEIRDALNLNIKTAIRSDELIKNNPSLLSILVETAFKRETQGEGAYFYDQRPGEVWPNSDRKIPAISHGFRVAREFSEHLPPKVKIV